MTDPSHLTRSDFEALLWDHLHRQLEGPPSEWKAATAVTPDQWFAFTDGERAEFRAALALVRSETARKVWDVNA